MHIYILHIAIILMIHNCILYNHKKDDIYELFLNHHEENIGCTSINQTSSNEIYDDYIYRYAKYYNVDADLVKAIIQVESNYNPTVVSKSNAIGLMQLKADTAGRDAYRLKGWNGKPSVCDLKNAVINIELGTAYLSILQTQLKGIVNTKTRRYAVIVAYVNGLGALLKIFSVDRIHAIKKINKLHPEEFFQYIKKYHPSKQAQRYLYKVNSVYMLKTKFIY